MHHPFSPVPRLYLLALLLAAPAVTGAAEAPPAATGPKAVAPAPAAAEKPAPVPVSAPEQKQPEAASAERPVKIGYVDLTRFGTETGVGKAAREKVRKKSESLEKQMNTRQKQLEKQKAALQLKLPTLTPQEQEAKAKEFEKKVDEYRNFMQNAEKEMKGLEAELTRQLYQDIEQAASAYGKANGFAAIVVKRDLLYVGSGVEGQDVTAEVLKRVNVLEEKK